MNELWSNITNECGTYGPAAHDQSRLDIGIDYSEWHSPIIRIDPTPHWHLEQKYRIRRVRVLDGQSLYDDDGVQYGPYAFIVERDMNFKG